jgi:hypothetical protein
MMLATSPELAREGFMDLRDNVLEVASIAFEGDDD